MNTVRTTSFHERTVSSSFVIILSSSELRLVQLIVVTYLEVWCYNDQNGVRIVQPLVE